jgi:peptidoglycan/xylan/chitin deacetylase (PgdA/CDA1 family)
LAITLDDGWAGNALLADVFRDEGVTPTIFVCTQVVGRARRFWWEHLRPEEVQELKRLDDDARIATLAAAGHPELSEGSTEPSALTLDDLRAATEWADVQSHTRLHPILPRCDDDRAWSEIAGSRDDLLAITGSEVYALAYPNGDCGSREMEMARSAGYLCALTVDARFISRRDNPYKIPRIAVQDSATRDELTAKLCGLHDLVRRALSPHRPEAGSRRGWLRPDT